MRIAIITGASSGLGHEFVKEIAEQKNLDEIRVIARRENRLCALSDKITRPIIPIALDLTRQESLSSLKALLQEKKPDIRILVNAAGFGKMGNYEDISEQDNGNMIELNCKALVSVTMIALPYMTRGARILEVCSVEAFQPLPGLNVYAASKAFACSYSRSLRWELLKKGIHVTAVCPYWIRDTEFIQIARNTANPQAVKHFPFASRAHYAARAALRDSSLNLPISTPGTVAFLQRILTKFIPHEFVIAFWEVIRRV